MEYITRDITKINFDISIDWLVGWKYVKKLKSLNKLFEQKILIEISYNRCKIRYIEL